MVHRVQRDGRYTAQVEDASGVSSLSSGRRSLVIYYHMNRSDKGYGKVSTYSNTNNNHR